MMDWNLFLAIVSGLLGAFWFHQVWKIMEGKSVSRTVMGAAFIIVALANMGWSVKWLNQFRDNTHVATISQEQHP